MILYFSPGACSLSPHITLREAGLPFTLERVDLASKQTASGKNYLDINPKGYVPALQLDDGTVLTEGPAITQYIADQVPAKHLAPPNGTIARYQLMAWLNFISTEIHKSFSPLFRKDTPDQTREQARAALDKRIGYVAEQLQKSPFLTGDQFTVADAYLFTVLRWAAPMKIDLSRWPAITAYMERIQARPAVQAALDAENASGK